MIWSPFTYLSERSLAKFVTSPMYFDRARVATRAEKPARSKYSVAFHTVFDSPGSGISPRLFPLLKLLPGGSWIVIPLSVYE